VFCAGVRHDWCVLPASHRHDRHLRAHLSRLVSHRPRRGVVQAVVRRRMPVVTAVDAEHRQQQQPIASTSVAEFRAAAAAAPFAQLAVDDGIADASRAEGQRGDEEEVAR